MPAPVLFVLHQEHSTPGRVAHILKSRGFAFDIRRPRLGDPLPDTLENHAGAVVFGGPNSANDEEEFMRREIDWLKVPLREEKPYLGICLGAQILARHLGSAVYCHRDGHVEIGYYPLRVTTAGREVCERGRTTSINGTAKASTCRGEPSCWPRETPFRSRLSAGDRAPMRSSSTRK